ncbi:MAG: phosphoenolpyruvate synthase [Candidatus Kerfeldbacteria bacterium]|nr:phosphoenolpyruvate synthase [Candidatus Kerfeldbacteria bacterium]
MAKRQQPFVVWFTNLGISDVPLVGGKNASLGEMYKNLTRKGVNVPNGYAITAGAYFYILKKAGIADDIRRILKGLDTHDVRDLQVRGRAVRKVILDAALPDDLQEEILANYHRLEKEYGKGVDVAVRSSATAEDLPDASFAGQQETFLNIRGEKALLEACKKCFASLFTDRAISYREDKKFPHFTIGLSIAVQKMVRSDKASSGVMFSIDTESGFKDVVLINGSWGLGENIVQGAVNPDQFYVHKPTLKNGFRPILSKKLGAKHIKMVYATGKHPTKNVPVAPADRNRFILTDDEILTLARWAAIIEDHYSREAGHFKPMDMEWAKDGVSGELYIVQARPETVTSQRDSSILEQYSLHAHTKKPIITGVSVGAKIGSGKARVIKTVSGIHDFKPGEVLVTDITDPDWEPIMKIAAAIVTNRGGRTSHAAIVSRELGIPAVVGCGNATAKIKTGQELTVSCSEGEEGRVYEGTIPFSVKRTNLKKVKRPKTKIQMIFGSPELAFHTAQIPNDGVGLARLEFIINSSIKIHPLALLHYPKLQDAKAKKQIETLTTGYTDKRQYFIDQLAYGVGTIAAAFYPNEVVVRLSDFKSNEYASLIGGREFEPHEENPMLGWRGASRYYDPRFVPAFEMECVALARVRKEMGLKNVKVMVPFCRTPEEGKKVIAIMSKNGLVQGKDGLEIFVMVEIPSDVLLADEFASVFDGFSIGSNDLTQLTLGMDRDSGGLRHIGDERNPAVKKLMAEAIRVGRKHKIKVGICGQGPSDFPELARFLVQEGITAISLSPDTVMKTMVDISKLESKLAKA